VAETRLHEVIDALVTAATAALDPELVLVSDGYPVTSSDGAMTVLAIGVDDPADEARADSGEATQEFANAAGRARNEAGTVRCAISTGDGDGVAKTARDAAFAVLAAVAAIVGGSSTPLDLPNVWKAGVTDVRLYQDQTEDGAAALLMFTVTYAARV
jgi:hypothetical protein